MSTIKLAVSTIALGISVASLPGSAAQTGVVSPPPQDIEINPEVAPGEEDEIPDETGVDHGPAARDVRPFVLGCLLWPNFDPSHTSQEDMALLRQQCNRAIYLGMEICWEKAREMMLCL